MGSRPVYTGNINVHTHLMDVMGPDMGPMFDAHGQQSAGFNHPDGR